MDGGLDAHVAALAHEAGEQKGGVAGSAEHHQMRAGIAAADNRNRVDEDRSHLVGRLAVGDWMKLRLAWKSLSLAQSASTSATWPRRVVDQVLDGAAGPALQFGPADLADAKQLRIGEGHHHRRAVFRIRAGAGTPGGIIDHAAGLFLGAGLDQLVPGGDASEADALVEPDGKFERAWRSHAVEFRALGVERPSRHPRMRGAQDGSVIDIGHDVVKASDAVADHQAADPFDLADLDESRVSALGTNSNGRLALAKDGEQGVHFRVVGEARGHRPPLPVVIEQGEGEASAPAASARSSSAAMAAISSGVAARFQAASPIT